MLKERLLRTHVGAAAREHRHSVRARRLESRLVWIFGSPRSDSTWLLALLAEQNAVIPVNEPLIGMYLSPLLAELPGMDPEALDLSNFTPRTLQRDVPSQFFAEEFRGVWERDLGTMIRNRLYAHATQHPARAPLSDSLVVVKEPNGSQSADLIMAALPRARLLFLLRDGRDVVDSELAVRRLREVLEWLGVTVSDSELERHVERHAFERIPVEQRGEDQFARAASPGLWRENLTAEEQAEIERLIGPKLRELGYECPSATVR